MLKTSESAGENIAATNDIRPTAKTQNAIGTTVRFASQRDRCDEVKIPDDEEQRTCPSRGGNRNPARDQAVTAFEESPRAADQAAREKRIGFGRSQQDAENAVLPDENRADHGERKLKPGSKKLVCVEGENKERGTCQTVERQDGTIEENSAYQKRGHDRGAQTRDMKTGDRRVEKETRNDKRCRGRARKAQERSQNPEQLRDDTDVQTGHGK